MQFLDLFPWPCRIRICYNKMCCNESLTLEWCESVNLHSTLLFHCPFANGIIKDILIWWWCWFSAWKQVHWLLCHLGRRVRAHWGGFPLPSSQTVMGEQLVQGCYAVAWGRFKPATLRVQGTEHTPTPPHPILIYLSFLWWLYRYMVSILLSELIAWNSSPPLPFWIGINAILGARAQSVLARDLNLWNNWETNAICC